MLLYIEQRDMAACHIKLTDPPSCGMGASSSIAGLRYSSGWPTGTRLLCRFLGSFSVSNYSEPGPLCCCCLVRASSVLAAMPRPFVDPHFSARHTPGSKPSEAKKRHLLGTTHTNIEHQFPGTSGGVVSHKDQPAWGNKANCGDYRVQNVYVQMAAML